MKRQVRVGRVLIGGGAAVSIQSMTNTKTEDTDATSKQIAALADAGCEMVRVSVYDERSSQAVRTLVEQSPVPLIADIHFDHRLAIAAMENGIAKLRINPGNIGSAVKVREVVRCAKAHRVPIRIGVNAGSLSKRLLAEHAGVTAEAMLESAREHVRLLEDQGFEDIVLSFKATSLRLMVEACRLADKAFDYPQHIGVTEAGLPGQGNIKSAIGIGALLLEGIGDTVRVSLTGSPLPEAEAAISILRSLGLYGVELISCPTCARTETDIEGIATQVEKRTRHIRAPLKVAVMGCVVNGPGEAREADVAYCGGREGGALYVRGSFVKKVTEQPAEEILRAIHDCLALPELPLPVSG